MSVYEGKELQNVIEFIMPTGISKDDFVLEILQPDEHYGISGRPCNGETSLNSDPMQVRIYVPKNLRLPLYAGVFKFTLNTKRELQVYALAHELYHVWQVKCDYFTFLLGHRLKLIDDSTENEADKYAVAKLIEWRKVKKPRK